MRSITPEARQSHIVHLDYRTRPVKYVMFFGLRARRMKPANPGRSLRLRLPVCWQTLQTQGGHAPVWSVAVCLSLKRA